MKFTLHTGSGAYFIRAYGQGEVVVNDETLTRSLIIAPQHLLRDWPPQSLETLTADHLQDILTLEPAVVLLGTGKALRFPESRLLDCFTQSGVGVEIMDTAAACRTYNVLLSEGRDVVAGLLIG